MKRLVGLIAAVASFSIFAQWQTSEVLAKDKLVAGYIYHTSATGTRIGDKIDKSYTSLRIVCSLKGNSPPVLVLFWQGMTGDGNEYPAIKIDGKPFLPKQEVWIQEGTILYRNINLDDQLFKSMTRSSKIEFTWTNSNVKYITGFETNSISAGLSNFSKNCQAQI